MAHPSVQQPLAPPRGAFQPYVSASQSPAEFTARAIILGSLFGLLFGASTVYLGLRAGLTVSASIPIAASAARTAVASASNTLFRLVDVVFEFMSSP